MGNICRSPTAEGVFRSIVTKSNYSENFEVDSAGTHAYNLGSCPDKRSQATAIKNGVDLSSQRARQVHESDFYYYNFIIAMDINNFEILKSIRPIDSLSQIELLLNYHTSIELQSIPDPYYEGKFDEVFDMVYLACSSFFESIVKKA